MKNNPNLPESVNNFLEKLSIKRPNAKMHNIYHIEAFDKNGNKTDEAVGLNLMTNLGMEMFSSRPFFVSSYVYSYIPYLWLCTTTTEPSLDNATIASADLAYDISISPTSYGDNVLPLETYDYSTDEISYSIKTCTFTLDYNLTDVSEDFSFCSLAITRNGANNTTNTVYCHALLYDENNNIRYFTKHINEKLVINIYWTYSVKAQILRNMYNNGLYYAGSIHALIGRNFHTNINISYLGPTLLSPITLINSQHAPFDVGSEYVSENTVMSRISHENGTYLSEDQHAIPFTSVTLTNSNTDNISYTYLPAAKLDAPEELSSDIVYADRESLYADKLSLRYSFGYSWRNGDSTGQLLNNTYYTNYGVFPVIDFNISSSYMFNHNTHEWDIGDTIQNNPNCDYNDSEFYSYGRFRTLYNDIDTTFFVYVNPKTNIPITRFVNNGGLPSLLYATDEYWDSSTYIPITSPASELPSNVQNKRYYISTTAVSDFHTIRDQTYHAIIPQTSSFKYDIETPVPLISRTFGYKFLSSDTNNWFMTETQLIYPDIDTSPIVHTLFTVTTSTSSVDNAFRGSFYNRWNTDDRILVENVGSINANNRRQYQNIRIYTVSDDGAVPSYVDMNFPVAHGTLDPTTSNVPTLHYSFNGYRYLVMMDNTNFTTGYLDIYGDDDITPSITDIAGYTAYGTVIYGTTHLVYHESLVESETPTYIRSESIWKIYDMATDTVISTFQLSDYVGAQINGVLAFSDNVYIKITHNSIIYVFHYDVNTETLSIINGFQPTLGFEFATSSGGNQNYYGDREPIGFVTCDDFIYVSTIYNDSSPQFFIFTKDDPTSPQQPFKSNGLSNNNYNKYAPGMRNMNTWLTPDNKHLISVGITPGSTTALNGVFDFGYFLDTKEQVFYPYNQCGQLLYDSISSIGGSGYYKGGIVRHLGDTGEIYWDPIAQYLPHKITGTTYTMQSYNNPRQYYLQDSVQMYLTNDSTLDSYTQTIISSGDWICKQNIGNYISNSKSSESQSVTVEEGCLLVAIVLSNDDITVTMDESGWNLVLESTSISSRIVRIYTKTVSDAGTYTATANLSSPAMLHLVLTAFYNVDSLSNITDQSVTLSSSVQNVTFVGNGNRRLVIFASQYYSTASHMGWWMPYTKTISYQSEETYGIIDCNIQQANSALLQVFYIPDGNHNVYFRQRRSSDISYASTMSRMITADIISET